MGINKDIIKYTHQFLKEYSKWSSKLTWTLSASTKFILEEEPNTSGKTEEVLFLELKNPDASLLEKSKPKELLGLKLGEDIIEKLKLTKPPKKKEKETSKLPELLLVFLLMISKN